MKEIAHMPVKVTNGDKEMEIYEWEDGFCMTTEFLGRCLGYANPNEGMGKLFRRNKEVLEPHRFLVTADKNLKGGRPSFFYDSEGCVLAAGRSGTPEAKEFLPRFLERLKKLEALRMERIENWWFNRARSAHFKEVRRRVMLGENFKQIADAIGRSQSSVRYAIKKMIEVGILAARRAAQALTGTARRAVLRYEEKARQLKLPFGETA